MNFPALLLFRWVAVTDWSGTDAAGQTSRDAALGVLKCVDSRVKDGERETRVSYIHCGESGLSLDALTERLMDNWLSRDILTARAEAERQRPAPLSLFDLPIGGTK